MNELLIHTVVSLLRLFIGTACSLVVGVTVGIVIGYFPRVRKICSPVIYALAPIPKVALLPVVMLMFGLGDAAQLQEHGIGDNGNGGAGVGIDSACKSLGEPRLSMEKQ